MNLFSHYLSPLLYQAKGMFLQGNLIYMKFNFRKKRSRRPYCQYSETEAHQSFVSRGIELYLKYGCGTPSEMIYHRRNSMYYCV